MTDPELDAMARVLTRLTHIPRPLDSLAYLTGLTRREVEQAVELARREGIAPICSGTDGIWLARDERELAADIERGERRIRTMLRTRNGQKRLLKRMRQPMTLGLE